MNNAAIYSSVVHHHQLSNDKTNNKIDDSTSEVTCWSCYILIFLAILCMSIFGFIFLGVGIHGRQLYDHSQQTVCRVIKHKLIDNNDRGQTFSLLVKWNYSVDNQEDSQRARHWASQWETIDDQIDNYQDGLDLMAEYKVGSHRKCWLLSDGEITTESYTGSGAAGIFIAGIVILSLNGLCLCILCFGCLTSVCQLSEMDSGGLFGNMTVEKQKQIENRMQIDLKIEIENRIQRDRETER